eukprot:scaffold392_cov60-Phaeocystis_antarctica.AAC.2
MHAPGGICIAMLETCKYSRYSSSTPAVVEMHRTDLLLYTPTPIPPELWFYCRPVLRPSSFTDARDLLAEVHHDVLLLYTYYTYCTLLTTNYCVGACSLKSIITVVVLRFSTWVRVVSK